MEDLLLTFVQWSYWAIWNMELRGAWVSAYQQYFDVRPISAVVFHLRSPCGHFSNALSTKVDWSALVSGVLVLVCKILVSALGTGWCG